MSPQNWYYTLHNRTFGPFTLVTLRQMAATGKITPSTLVAQEGDPGWKKLSEVPASAPAAPPPTTDAGTMFTRLAGGVSQVSGLEKLEGFSLAVLFAEVFRRHTPEEIEEHFAVGTAATTPPLQKVATTWPAPWAFFRVLGFSLLGAFGFYWARLRFDYPAFTTGWLLLGCFGIPLSVLLFFVETNVLRNVSAYRVVHLLFLGGLVSLIFTGIFNEVTGLSQTLGAVSAGIIEESAKLLTVIVFTRHWKQYHWTLNGMLFGAAVGTGFSALETAGYVTTVAALDRTGYLETAIMGLRSLLSPFTHTIWTAASAGALWRVRDGRPFAWTMLLDLRFLRVFLIVVALHCVWNSGLKEYFISAVGDVVMALVVFGASLGLVGWTVVLLLMQSGLKQVRVAKAAIR